MTFSDHEIIGRSAQGRAIELIQFANRYQQVLKPQLDTLFIGAFHGDEPISTELLEAFVGYCQDHMPSRSIGIIPALNPDGLFKKQRVNVNGVDLNRNFPTKNWCEENHNDIYYSGPSAASEPETRVLINVIESLKPAKIITVHSPYRVVNFDGPARSLAEVIAACNQYRVVDDIGYATPGSFGTWAGKERKIPTITLELPEDESFETVWEDNLSALLAAISYDIPG